MVSPRAGVAGRDRPHPPEVASTSSTARRSQGPQDPVREDLEGAGRLEGVEVQGNRPQIPYARKAKTRASPPHRRHPQGRAHPPDTERSTLTSRSCVATAKQ